MIEGFNEWMTCQMTMDDNHRSIIIKVIHVVLNNG